MTFVPLDLPPGVRYSGTAYQSAGRWRLSRLVRWISGAVAPFGGWLHMAASATGDGPGRGMLCWRPSSYVRSAIFGTPDSLYVWDEDSLINVTPVGFAAGVADSFTGPGYGFGDYGEGAYGVSAGSAATTATSWFFDNWGSHVVALASHDGVIYEYKNNGMPAEPVANAPTAAAIFVTEEGSLVALGVDGNMRLGKWTAFQDNTDWVPDPSNEAGDWPFQTDGTLVTGKRVRGTNLIWTTTDLWKMTYIGGVFVYQITLAAPSCGLVAPRAVQGIDSGAIWMGQKNFFLYNGSQALPLECDLQDYVFGDINFTQAAKFHCGRVAAFGETLFFYCSANSDVIDRCVSYNERTNHWTIVDPDGVMARGCWADVGAFANPLAVGEDGKLYEQESGWTANGTPITTGRYVRSGPVEAGNGDRVMHVHRVLPDENTAGKMQLTFYSRFAPEGTVYPRGPYTVVRPQLTTRVSARQTEVELASTEDADFRFGIQRLDVDLDGQR